MPAFWAPTGRVPLGSPQTRWTPLTSPPEEGPGDSTAPKGEQKGQATWLNYLERVEWRNKAAHLALSGIKSMSTTTQEVKYHDDALT